ncbi:PPE family protein [Mycobacterium sp. M1]|uniref:PPE family protein n=1 Tax=Mycolicibacter acidiphilus TaxID=2835306 RepID=A0ABS5RG37_9MYCO|nr:PPE family protein [Mycolicibacter acidiphilus]MBS9532431.1 PPE family protein [Mycolicibacter acidiphilus]
MFEFGMLPPEVSSARMYTGPGPGPLMAAGAAWSALAGELNSFAQGYATTIAQLLSDGWAGPASAAMAAAAAPYTDWAVTTSGYADRAAGQARAAAAAFEAAHATITPPAAVSANRALLAQLIATNMLGHNTVRIAATEAAYDAMWAHNARTMHRYAAAAASATQLPAFEQPPQEVNPAGAAAAAATVAANSGTAHPQTLAHLLAAVPQHLSAASTGATAQGGIPIPQSWLTGLKDLGTVQGPVDTWLFTNIRNVGAIGDVIVAPIRILSDGTLYSASAGLTGTTAPAGAGAVAPTMLAGSSAAAGTAVGGRAVLASVGEATAVGQLSAPQTWAQLTPVAAVNDQWLPIGPKGAWEEAAPRSVGRGAAGLAPMAGAAGAAGAAKARKPSRPTVSAILQTPPPRYSVPRHTAGG